MGSVFGIISKHSEISQQQKNKFSTLLQEKSNVTSVGRSNTWFSCSAILPHPASESQIIEDEQFIFIGRIFLHNRKQIIKELTNEKKYEQYSDLELVFETYKRKALNFINHIEGEFSLFIWDKLQQTLNIVADHIGIQPIFYCNSSSDFIFSSEIKLIEAVKQTPNYFDISAFHEYFFRSGNTAHTYNVDIQRLCGGSQLKFSAAKNEVVITRYWNLERKGKYNFKNDDDWYNCMEAVFSEAVEVRIPTQGNVGISLSGGLDSGAIACILSKYLKKKNMVLHGFSAVLPQGYTGKLKDERYYLECLQKKCDNLVIKYIETNMLDALKRVEKAFNDDQVIPNALFFMDQAIINKAQEQRIQTLFSGFGGDVWASSQGFSVIAELVRQMKYKTAFLELRNIKRNYKLRWSSAIKKELLRHFRISRMSTKKEWDFSTCVLPSLVSLRKRKHSKESLLIGDHLINSGWLGNIASAQYSRANTHSIFAAIPFLDKRLFEFLIEVPLELFIKGGIRRSFFRNSMRNILPEEICNRRTKTYYVPDYPDVFYRKKEDLISFYHFENNKSFLQNFFRNEYLMPLAEEVLNRSETNDFEEAKMIRLHQIVVFLSTINILKSRNFVIFKKN